MQNVYIILREVTQSKEEKNHACSLSYVESRQFSPFREIYLPLLTTRLRFAVTLTAGRTGGAQLCAPAAKQLFVSWMVYQCFLFHCRQEVMVSSEQVREQFL